MSNMKIKSDVTVPIFMKMLPFETYYYLERETAV